MGGLYNMIMGVNPYFGPLCGAVGIHAGNFKQYGRLRDAWITEDASTINILHRNYGSDGVEYIEHASKLPGFVANHVASDDETYSWYEFNTEQLDMLEAHRKAAKMMLRNIARISDNTNCFIRYQQAIADFTADKQSPQTDHMREVGKQLCGALAKAADINSPTTVDCGDVVITKVGGSE